MAWASSGGYPGVLPDGAGGLITGNSIAASSFDATDGGPYFVTGATGNVIAIFGSGTGVGSSKLDGGIGLFNHAPPGAATAGGAHTAGGTYTAVEQAMLEAVYTALQSIGLVT